LWRERERERERGEKGSSSLALSKKPSLEGNDVLART